MPESLETKGDTGATGEAGATGERGKTGKIQRPAIVGYLLLAIGVSLGVYFTGQRAADDLKDNINNVVKAGCLASRAPNSTINKFNDFLDDQIQINKQAKIVNENQGAIARAKINKDAIDRYMKDKIHIPTVKECNIPALK